MNLEFEEGSVSGPPSHERLQWFENAYKVRLPQSLLTILANGNGGIPVRKVFLQGTRERVIERFLPILDMPKEAGELGWYDIGVVISQIEDRLIEDEDLEGTDVLPIAALFGGDFLCLDYRDGESAEPPVVVWDHELSEEGAPHFEPVSMDLATIISSLK